MRFPRDPAVMRKFLVALVGAIVIIALQFGVIVPDALSDSVVAVIDSVIALLTAAGVFAVPNAPMADPAVVPEHEDPITP